MARHSLCAGSKTATDVEVTEVGDGLFRLDEEPLLWVEAESEGEAEAFPRFGDTVLAERLDPHTLRYLRVHARGPYRHDEFMLTPALIRSAPMATLLAQVVREGGHWERHLGGLLVISLAESSTLKLAEGIDRARSVLAHGHLGEG